MKRVSFSNANPNFTITLKKKVDEHFATNNLKLTGNSKLYLKTFFLLSLAVALYVMLVFVSPPTWISLSLCVLLGFNLAAIGFNVMHDGAHGSYSEKKWVNDAMSYSLDLMGGSSFLWKLKHNVIHHSFTNIEGHDDDIDIQPWMRTHADQPKHWFHRYQHIYWVFFYGIAYMSWVFLHDFQKYFSRKIANTPIKKISIKEHLIFWGSKLLYMFTFLTLPIMRLGWADTLIGYLVVSSVCGLVISVIFQLAHVVEDASFHVPDADTNKVQEDWTIHQLATTANFSTNSRFLSWFTGGLNFQVEHHLFPRISHIHYPAISKLVKEVCLQFSIPYNEYPTLLSAVRSHVVHLRAVGLEK